MSASPRELQRDIAGLVGRRREEVDRITARPAQILAATFDRDAGDFADGDPIPPGWHWLYFHEVVALSDCGNDGHPATGWLLPPVTLPRRMWAGNRMRFHRPLHVAEPVRRVSSVTRATLKSGASGTLAFITVRHELSGVEGLATVEEHDIVYRAPTESGAPVRPPPRAPDARAQWRREIAPSPVLLFRFSALTMNSHRIHYDRDFCVQHEGYPGLLVHGPLTMLLLLDLFSRHRPDATVEDIAVRATSPLHDTAPFSVNGGADDGAGTATVWAAGPDGSLAMSGELSFRR